MELSNCFCKKENKVNRNLIKMRNVKSKERIIRLKIASFMKICRNNPTYEGISGGETFDKFRQV